MNYLRIATWNANGLVNKIHELEVFLREEKIDICLISETHFTKQSYVRVKGYTTYHSTHPSNKARGGSAVIIKDSVKHTEDIKIDIESMQVTTVCVQTKCKKINISAIYCPPRYSLLKSDYLDLLESLGSHFIVGGDFNAKHTYWGSRLSTPKGKMLYAAGKEANCDFYSSGKPTYWPTDLKKVPDLIDFFAVKGLSNNYIEVTDCSDLTSDHTPVILTISETLIQREAPPRLTTCKTDWDGFRIELESLIELQVPLQSPEQLEKEVNLLVDNIQQAAWNNTPDKARKFNNVNFNYPLEVHQLVKEKRKARKKWHKVVHQKIRQY